jgi:hypothetical protein
MSVEGRLLEITPHRFDDGHEVLRLWVVATNAGGPGVHDEVCVYAEPQESLPAIGDSVWWQSGRIYFDNDRQHLKKVGYSFSAPSA